MYFLLCFFSLSLQASYKGEIIFESRVFTSDHNNSTKDQGLAMSPHFEFYHENDKLSSKLAFFARHDFLDEQRKIFIPEDIYGSYQIKNWKIFAGLKILNWSATEAFHPADVINSRNFDSNLENAEKIGEPMLQITYLTENGSYNLYFLPYITKPNLAQSQNRLSFATAPIHIEDPVNIDKDGKTLSDSWTPQWAFRWEKSFNNTDIAIYALEQQNKYQPIYVINNNKLTPYTLPSSQYGIILQHVIDSAVLKLETATIHFKDENSFIGPVPLKQEDHSLVAFGFDYTINHLNSSESTLILEGQTITDTGKVKRSTLNVFQKDLLFGYRFSFNDILNKQIFVSLISDLERGREHLVTLSYSQRLNDKWNIKSFLRYIDAPQKSFVPSGLEFLDKDNQVGLNLIRYF